MVSTIQILPALLLQPYISCYALRTFDTGEASILKPMHAVHEYYMTFFLRERFCGFIDNSGVWQSNKSNSLCTLFTQNQGFTSYQGKYAIFCVQFKSNGLFAILGNRQKELINSILALDEIIGSDNSLLTEQLESTKNIIEMGKLMDAYFLGRYLCKKHKEYTNVIACTSDVILQNRGMISLALLSRFANMSQRNFERRFLDEVGVAPKLYARITRFNKALDNKMLHPEKRWTDIAYENGYFDQAHFIKEVHLFSSKSPEELFRNSPPPIEDYKYEVEQD
ncbi:MAG: AraC family transcriptional regulator [Ginsengibacter sp.]